jgi:hypothetical protein
VTLSLAKDTTVAAFSGWSFRAVEIAVKELSAKGLLPDQYEIVVWGGGDSRVCVSFVNAGRTHDPEVRGNPGPLQEFQVTLDAKSLCVLKSNFVR